MRDLNREMNGVRGCADGTRPKLVLFYCAMYQSCLSAFTTADEDGSGLRLHATEPLDQSLRPLEH